MNPRRDPAMILALIASLVQVVSSFVFPLTSEQQALVNAVAVAVAGIVTAVAVGGDKLLAAILGLAQAVIALAAGFGAALPAEQQAALMGVLTIAGAMWLRTQVVAPVPPTQARAVAVEGNPDAAEATS